MSKTFQSTGELNDLYRDFLAELKKGPISLGQLEENLKPRILACEQKFPIYAEIRKFERPQHNEGSIEGSVTVPQLTTMDSSRAIDSSSTGGTVRQKVNSKTTFMLDADCLSKLAALKKEDKESNQWEYLEELSKKLGNLSFTFNCTSTYTEGGHEDPVQTLSLVDANVSSKSSEDVLAEFEEKMLIGPNASAFQVSTVNRVYAFLVYAPQGEALPSEWGSASTVAAQQFHDER